MYYPKRVRALLLTPVDLSAEALTQLWWDQSEQWSLPERLTTFWYGRTSPTKDQLAGITAPTLFVIGKDEQFVKLDHVAWQYESIPGAEVVWIPGADHILVAKPDAVNKAFLSFLDRQR
jgi:pimeloyl-ACP methyl ester carboxylesterase